MNILQRDYGETHSGPAGIAQLDYEKLKASVKAPGKARPLITAHACAIYARKSTKGQDSEEMQVEEAREYAHDTLRVPIYTFDDTEDGEAVFQEIKSGLITDRPKYQALKELIRSRKISHVILWIPSRWGRNTIEFLTAFAELDAMGVEVHSTTEGRMTWDKVDEEAYKAKAESITISKRVTPAMRRRAKKGEVMQQRPYGYLKAGANGVVASKVTEIDPEAASVVAELFRRYIEDGESIHSLTAWFNGTTGLHKRAFGVRRLLENSFYAGIIVYGKERKSLVRNDNGANPRNEWIMSNHGAPIVSVEMWQAAQDRLAQNTNRGQQRGKEPGYPLTGLLFCAGTPGKTCTDAPKRMHGQRDESGKYPFYLCPYCGKSKSQRKIEKALRSLLETIPVGLDAVAAVSLKDAPNTTQAADVEQQITKLQTRRAKLMTRWADAATPDDEQAAQDAIDLTDAELTSLRVKSLEATREHVADKTLTGAVEWLKGIDNWAELLDDTTAAEQNEVYRNIVSRCTVDIPGNTMAVEWLPWAAKLTGETEQTVPLLTKAQEYRPKR